MNSSILILLCAFIGLSWARPADLLANDTVLEGCGGVVRIGVNATSVVSFLENENLRNYERCLWSVLPDDPAVAFETITMTIESYGFQSSDYSTGFIFYSWTERGFFEATRVYAKNGGETTFETSQGFLSFTSASYADEGTGFRLSFTAVASEAPSKVESRQIIDLSNLGVGKACGEEVTESHASATITYPEFPAVSYPANTKVAIVLPEKGHRMFVENQIQVTYLDSEQGLDTLELIALRAYDFRDVTHYRIETRSGAHPEGFNATLNYDSIVVLFSSDSTNSGRGFQIQYDNGL